MLIFLLATISAQVSIFPNPLNIDQTVGKTETYTITINNSFDFSVFNFKLGDLETHGFSFPDIYVNSTSSESFEISVSPTSSISEILNNKIEFNYFAEIPEQITTYEIIITKWGFEPTYMIIREGDSIKWINQDDIVHRVYSQLFNEQISPNMSYSHTFNTKGNYIYQDPNWDEYYNFNGEIDVINRTSQEKVHNPNYDFFWATNINFVLNPTKLNITWFDNYFKVGATSKTESSIKITNTGNEIAENIELTSDSTWINFEENNIDLSPGDQNYINYEIQPKIFNTEETNKTYEIVLFVEGSNTQQYSKTIEVFVPYSEVFQGIGDEESFLMWFEEVFCPEHPNNYFCNPNKTIIVEGDGTGNYTIPINVSEASWREIKENLARVTTAQIRTSNDLQILADQYGITLPELLEIVNASYQQQTITEKKRRANTSTISLLLFFAFLFAFIGLLINKAGKNKRKKSLTEGMYETKYGNY